MYPSKHNCGKHDEGNALIPDSHNVHCNKIWKTQTNRFGLLSRQARSETQPTTSLFNFMQFLAQVVQSYMAAQGYFCHLPLLQEMGSCSARSVQPDDKLSAIAHVVFTRAARRKGVAAHPPGVLLGHHVQPNRSACFHCFNRDAGQNQTSSLRTMGSFFKRKKNSSPYGLYLPGTSHCAEVVRSRTLSQASRKGHRTSSHNGSIRSDTTPSLAIAALFHKASSQL